MRILATVGAQMSFDRLLHALDSWAAGCSGEHSILAQIGPSAESPKHMEWVRFLEPAAFKREVERADLLIAHAGMGTILTALTLRKPIIVMPRRGDLRETRNDHQIATARRFEELGRVAVANDAVELAQWLDEPTRVPVSPAISSHADSALIGAIRSFIAGELMVPRPEESVAGAEPSASRS